MLGVVVLNLSGLLMSSCLFLLCSDLISPFFVSHHEDQNGEDTYIKVLKLGGNFAYLKLMLWTLTSTQRRLCMHVT